LDVLTGLVSVRDFRHRLTVFDTRRSPSVGTCTVSVGVDEERGSGLAGTLALNLVLDRFGFVVDAEDGRMYDSDSIRLGPLLSAVASAYAPFFLPLLPAHGSDAHPCPTQARRGTPTLPVLAQNHVEK